MKYGIVFPKSDPLAAVEMAVEAEKAGWDAFFVWETAWGVDPWVTLGAAAARTSRIRLGTLLTPLPIRQPWKLASETASLDVLSGGRAILSAGLGAVSTGFGSFGLPTDLRVRAERMDEALDVLTGLWPARPFSYEGKHFRIQEQDFIPAVPPVQQRSGVPHIPIWMVGAWPRKKSMHRVLRCDGLLPNVLDPEGKHLPISPEAVREMRRWLDDHTDRADPFDLIVDGTTPGDDQARQQDVIGPFIDAGASWWVETLWQQEDMAAIRRRFMQGPPLPGGA